MRRGDIWWADFAQPSGATPGYRRPVLIVQADWANATRLRTVTVAAITSNLEVVGAPGNVLVEPHDSGLRKASIVNASQILTLDRQLLTERVGRLPPSLMREVDDGRRLLLDL